MIPAKTRKRAENIEDPVENVDERDADGDHRAAHDERAEDAPKQQAMLKFRRHAEIGKDDRHDQDVVERERKFDDIAGGELDRFLAAAPDENGRGKQHGQREPARRSRRWLP